MNIPFVEVSEIVFAVGTRKFLLPAHPGIYRIHDSVSKKNYIGSSVNVSTRYNTHICELKAGYHGNPHMANCWNRHGPDSFVFFLVECCDSTNLTERENFWIRKYDGFNRKVGFNIADPEMRVPPVNLKKSYRPQYKLSPSDIPAIFDLLASGKSDQEVAEMFGVTRHTIMYVKLRRSWSEVFIPPELIATAQRRKSQCGERGPTSKLSEPQVREILRRSVEGESRRSLAEEFGVAEVTITKIRNRTLWPHLDIIIPMPRYGGRYPYGKPD